jgi:hypothetical protein
MLFSLFSFITFTNYIIKGSVDHKNFYIPCGPIFVIVFAIIILLFNSYNALMVYKNTKSNNILKIFYIFLIYMPLIIILILAVFFEVLHNLLIVAFPIFFIGAFLLPTCTYIVYMETIEKIERRITKIECFNCRYEFEINPQDKEKECPLCGALNRIPFK